MATTATLEEIAARNIVASDTAEVEGCEAQARLFARQAGNLYARIAWRHLCGSSPIVGQLGTPWDAHGLRLAADYYDRAIRLLRRGRSYARANHLCGPRDLALYDCRRLMVRYAKDERIHNPVPAWSLPWSG